MLASASSLSRSDSLSLPSQHHAIVISNQDPLPHHITVNNRSELTPNPFIVGSYSV